MFGSVLLFFSYLSNKLYSETTILQTIKLDFGYSTVQEEFKQWFLTAKSQVLYMIFLHYGPDIMIIGYKSDNNYGCFFQMVYSNIGFSRFCDISNGVFNF